MRLEVRKLQQRLSLTTVFVTHDQQEALSISDVVAVMNRGRVEQVGTPAEVYQRPRSEFVADFVGSTNLMPGVVRGYDAVNRQAVVEVEGGVSTLQVWHDQPLVPGAQVKVLCKPEQLRVIANVEACVVRGQLSAAAYLGSVTQYQVELLSCSLEVVMPAEQAPMLELGSHVGVELPTQMLRLIEL
jgi:ABC-type Fe3+/spermidine/putrescine transport system ATPase subunit